MGFLKRLGKKVKKVVDFEKFNLKDIGDKLKDDPKRLLLGVDKGSTKVWNKVLGRDDEPIVNEWGGPTPEAYQRATEAGIDVGPGAGMHQIAQAIAGTIAGGYGLDKLAGAKGALGQIGQKMGGNPAASGPKVTGGGIADAAGNIIPGTEGVVEGARQGALGRVFGIPKGGIQNPTDVMNMVSTGTSLLGAAGPLLTGSTNAGAPPVEEGVSQPPVSFNRQRLAMPTNLRNYGKSGGGHRFFGPAAFTPVHPSDGVSPPPGPGNVPPSDPVKYVPRQVLGGFAEGGPLRASSPQFVSGQGSGRDDTVEALLSDGEYVVDAESVALLGDGSLDEGAKRLDELRANLRKHKGAALAQGKFSPAAKDPTAYMAKGGSVASLLARIRKSLAPQSYEDRLALQERQRRLSPVTPEEIMEELRRLDPNSPLLNVVRPPTVDVRRPSDAEILGEAVPPRRAKGGSLRVAGGQETVAARLQRLRKMLQLERELKDQRRTQTPEPRPPIRRAQGGEVDIKEARNRVSAIQSLSKTKPYKPPVKTGDPVAELRNFADRLEATLKNPLAAVVEQAKGAS
jgi:hypothetical protein